MLKQSETNHLDWSVSNANTDEDTKLKSQEIFKQLCDVVGQIHDINKTLTSLGSSKKGKTEQRRLEIEAEMNQLREHKQFLKHEENKLDNDYKLAQEREKQQARIDHLNRLQAERDKYAQRQNNNTGRSRNRQRDIAQTRVRRSESYEPVLQEEDLIGFASNIPPDIRRIAIRNWEAEEPDLD